MEDPDADLSALPGSTSSELGMKHVLSIVTMLADEHFRRTDHLLAVIRHTWLYGSMSFFIMGQRDRGDFVRYSSLTFREDELLTHMTQMCAQIPCHSDANKA